MKAIVLDTSVVVAGLLSRRGASALLIDSFFADRLRLAYTGPILAEYLDVLARPQFAEVISPSDRVAIMLKVRSSGHLVTPDPVPDDNWPDPDDLPFVAAALATPARTLVTFNARDFAPVLRHRLRVLSPTQTRREWL